MPDKNEENNVEMLGGLEENPYLGKTTDIKQVTFQHLNNDITLNDSNLNFSNVEEEKEIKPKKEKKERIRETKEKEKTAPKVKVKKVGVPASFVIFLLLLVNVVWYCAVHFFMMPDYEKYKQESASINERIDKLENLLKAIVGE